MSINHLCAGRYRLFANEAFLNARSTGRATIDVTARSEKSVALHIGANHALIGSVGEVAGHFGQSHGAHLLR